MTIDINQANEGVRSFIRGGIAGVLALNSGAMIALLTQLSDLAEKTGSDALRCSFRLWIMGDVFGALCWMFASLAASAHVREMKTQERIWTPVGYLSFLASLTFFAFGAWQLADSTLPN
ncbi:hypothetical protein [Paracoccus saliphilus]|uniref:Uncharacterized protein n=1 Tax=Paracoccus saliphilus TaxID=405559 RepID=A0ABY7SFD3_9RHOB|nr:hypothetical protein [Paracoccus saliphilus]WCR04566.1 hypothetical protein JHX88_07565 [Paracoccus saliphilus]